MADDGMNVGAALATLRGEMAAGFERLDGKLNLISSAQATTARDIEATNARVKAVEDRTTALEERRWPLGVLTVLATVVAAVAAIATWALTN
jgi:hypothetical protein